VKRTGIADSPLHGGKAPRWLFQRMTGLARQLIIACCAGVWNQGAAFEELAVLMTKDLTSAGKELSLKWCLARRHFASSLFACPPA